MLLVACFLLLGSSLVIVTTVYPAIVHMLFVCYFVPCILSIAHSFPLALQACSLQVWVWAIQILPLLLSCKLCVFFLVHFCVHTFMCLRNMKQNRFWWEMNLFQGHCPTKTGKKTSQWYYYNKKHTMIDCS